MKRIFLLILSTQCYLLALARSDYQPDAVMQCDNNSYQTLIVDASRLAAQPNILVIVTEDHSREAISAYHGRFAEVLKTPNIDKLAAQGVLMNNYFTVNAVCIPARAGILTGQYPQHNGVYTLRDKLSPENPHIGKDFQRGGYRTAFFGKWGLGAEPAGFDYYSVYPGQGRYSDPVMIEKGEWTGASFDKATGNEYKGNSVDLLTDALLDWIGDRNSGKPFLAFCEYNTPHRPWLPDEKYAGLLERVTLPEPPNMLERYEGKATQVGEVKLRLDDLGPKDTKEDRPEGLTPDGFGRYAYQKFVKDYLRCVATVDDNVGRILDFLERTGLSQNTIVIYTSDQGTFLGEHGFFDKRLMYEEAIRTPLIVRFPDGACAGSVNDDMTLNIDLAPTLAAMAKLPLPDYVQGRSLLPNLEGNRPGDWRQSMYYRYWMHADADHNVPAHYGVRDGRYKLIFFYGQPLGMTGAREIVQQPAWEFYDLQEDPLEMKNRYANPSYKNEIERLKNELLRLKETYDDKDEKYSQMKEVIEKYW